MLTENKGQVSAWVAKQLSIDSKKIMQLLETPKELSHGHLSLPVFFMAKELRKAPPMIAKDFAEKLEANKPECVQSVKAIGGYVNFFLDNMYLQESLLREVFEKKRSLGFSSLGCGKKVVIDFSSPNVAKRMSIGHLRATVIGQAVYNLAVSQGYEVIGLNHLGDWGTQFGKLAWAIDEWGSEYPLKEEPMASLTQLYVRFHEEAEEKPEIEVKGAEYFKRLEEGDEHLVQLWQKIVNLSMVEYNGIWKMMGVKHDLVLGESFYNDQLKPTERLLEDKELLVESEGAMVVELAEGKPPCLIRKSDGASLYATRDIASAIYRHDVLGADINLYVVGQDQTLHFQQIFEVLKKMGYDWAEQCHHVSFGMYKFKDIGKMSTRKGTVIVLEDVVVKAIDLVRKLIEEKNPDLDNKEDVAQKVGMGAIIFNDLMNDRIKNVDFDWERALNFDGDSGPYVQYCVVRCRSILRKFGKEVPKTFAQELILDEERDLIKLLVSFDEVLEASFSNFKPHYVANYLIEVCRCFSHFYHKCRVIGESEKIESSRISLIYCAERVLTQGLKMLNIEAPEEM